MKKAKLILACIFVMGTIGASLAYKANRVGSDFYVESTNGVGLQCTVFTNLPYVTAAFGVLTIRASLSFYTGSCTVLSVQRSL